MCGTNGSVIAVLIPFKLLHTRLFYTKGQLISRPGVKHFPSLHACQLFNGVPNLGHFLNLCLRILL